MNQYCIKIIVAFVIYVISFTVYSEEQSNTHIGIIEPRQIISIGSPVAGIVESLPVDRGSKVTRGTVLAQLNSKIENIDYAIAKTRFELMTNRYNRQTKLESASAASDEEVEQARIEMQLAKLEMERRAEFLQQRKIRASVDGVVLKRLVREGEYVYEQVSIVEVAQINPLNVELVVPNSEYGKILPGMEAEVTLDEPIYGNYTAQVEVVDDVLDVASGSFGVRLILENSSGKIPSGVKCHVRFKENSIGLSENN